MKESFQSNIESIAAIFREYSLEDVAKSIFVSNLWLPNIHSTVKHQLLTSIFATLKPEEFSTKDQIIAYEGFKSFLVKVYNIVPSFPTLEGYIPQPDWGEVKFHCEGKNYKMFYGNELSNVYDYLILYQMLYEPYENEYMQHAQRSPTYELRYCLRLQEDVIEGITVQPDPEKLRISSGYLEIPLIEFWENAQSFFSEFRPEEIVPAPFIEKFCINLGEYPKEALNYDTFGEKVFTGQLVPAFFIKHKSRYFPILPRRYSSILFDKWANVFQKHSEKVEPDKKRYALRIGAQIHKYIKKRVMTDSIFPVTSAVTKDDKPHETIFTTAFVSGKKLILIYLTEPCLSSKNTEQELERITAELNKVVELVKRQPTTLALRLDRKNVQFRSKSNQDTLEPEILILIPQVSTEIQPFAIPEKLPARVMFLESFLGIIDELDDERTLADFFDYLDEIENKIDPYFSPLDKFASFKDSHGILIGGAAEPDWIMIDPHWGTRMRYHSLADFWEIYPEADFFDHPRTWNVKKETETRTRLIARGYLGTSLYSQLGETNIYFTSPFHEMEYEQGKLSNLLMECLEDSMSKRKSIIQEHQFFNQCDRLHFIFFPLSVVSKNERFKYLRELCNITEYWCSDIGMPDYDTYGIRIVFDEKAITKALSEAQDCSIEVDILLEVMNQLNKVFPDDKLPSIIELLEKTKSGRPRFKMFSVKKPASFPEFISPLEPKPTHFKKAKKRIAELAKQLGIEEGEYQLENAKEIINKLKDAIVAEINSEVTKYDFETTIPFLITRIDALNAGFEHDRHMVEQALEFEIDYKPEARHAEQHTHYTKTHRNYRYLLEKVIQLEPKGKEVFGREQFQYFIALIDWLNVFYSASDNLHYGIMPLGMKLDSEYLAEVIYEDDMEEKDKAFAELFAKLELGIIGNPNDRVESPRPVKEYLEALDEAIVKDLGFSFKSMINVLQIMCYWPSYAKDVKESTYYSAFLQEIEDACTENIAKIKKYEIKLIVDFLTLKKAEVLRLRDQDEPCKDLPVWEYRKRYARYNLRPIVKIGDKFYWGPYSVRRTGFIWSGTTGAMPTDLKANTVEEVLRTEKKLIEDALEDNTLEIIKRYTVHARKNLELYKLKPKGTHPSELGDYDVLSFYQDKNVILNIECKDILPPYCLKDAKRLREKIFGRPGKNQGHFEQINKRQDYLEKNILDIAAALEWPVDPNNPPKIICIYLSRRVYWWTNYPPEKINAVFLRIDLLADFIQNLEA